MMHAFVFSHTGLVMSSLSNEACTPCLMHVFCYCFRSLLSIPFFELALREIIFQTVFNELFRNFPGLLLRKIVVAYCRNCVFWCVFCWILVFDFVGNCVILCYFVVCFCVILCVLGCIVFNCVLIRG